MASYEIKKYQVHVSAGAATNAARSYINLFDEKSNTIGTLIFLEGAPMPGNTLTGVFQGYFPLSSYPAIIDLLRNEKPVYLTITGSDLAIVTQLEAVGEDEPAVGLTSPVFKFPL